MSAHYKIFKYRELKYRFTTGTKTKEECLAWIEGQFDYLPFYTVMLNGEKVAEKKATKKYD